MLCLIFYWNKPPWKAFGGLRVICCVFYWNLSWSKKRISSISFLCRKWTERKCHLRMWRASISKCSHANKRKSSIAGLKCSSMSQSQIWSVFPSFKQTATTMVHEMKSQAQDRLPPVWLLTWLLSSWMPFLTKGASLIPKAKLPSNSKNQAKISKLQIVFYLFEFQIWIFVEALLDQEIITGMIKQHQESLKQWNQL